jgi:hypothetical protein
VLAALLAVCGLALTVPAAAQAHGPVAPLASSFLARVGQVPAGLRAQVIDGDQRMWLRAPAAATVVVLDYRGAPYVRFSPSGVAVNTNSEMYYLNQTPVAATPPASLTRATPPRWQPVSGGHEYSWHDGRLHALATVARAPGASYVGRWTIPIVFDGHPLALAGGLWHADTPSPVWFWAVAVLLLCLLAALRLERPLLDQRLARALAVVTLVAVAVASAGRELHGRPGLSAFSLAELGVILALVGLGLRYVLARRSGFLITFVTAFAGVWEGVSLLTTLLNGYVLMAVPAVVARSAAVLCLGGGIGQLLLSFRLAERPGRPGRRAVAEPVDDHGQAAPHPV